MSIPDEPGGLSWVAVLRSHHVRAVLVFETAGTVRDADSGEDLQLAHYRDRGFAVLTETIETLHPPTASDWRLRWRADNLELHGPEGLREVFEAITATAPAAWVQAVRKTRRCIVVGGTRFGLERASVDRINQGLHLGTAFAAVVPVIVR